MKPTPALDRLKPADNSGGNAFICELAGAGRATLTVFFEWWPPGIWMPLAVFESGCDDSIRDLHLEPGLERAERRAREAEAEFLFAEEYTG